MRFDGDEFVQNNMIPGWMILLSILVKPSLIIIGFVLSIAIFFVTSAFIHADFVPFVTQTIGGHDKGVLMAIVMVALLMAAYIILQKLSFRLMTVVPDNIIHKWMGGPSTAQREEQDAEAAVAGIASTKAAGGGIHKATGAAQRVGKGAASAMSNRNPTVQQKQEGAPSNQQREDSVPREGGEEKDNNNL